MRRLPRIELPQRVTGALREYQQALDRQVKAERKKKRPATREIIDAAWNARLPNKALTAVRVALNAMASGSEHCMYCEGSRAEDIEHFRPKASYPERAFDWLNLLKICPGCNRQKNDAFDARLLDPTADDPLDHLLLSLRTGRYVAREESPRGRVTLRILRRLASDQVLVRGRRDAFLKLGTFLRDYHSLRVAGRDAEARLIRRCVVREPFSAVFAALLRASREAGAGDVLGDELMTILARHPEMYKWLRKADDKRVARAMTELDTLARSVRIRAPRRSTRSRRSA